MIKKWFTLFACFLVIYAVSGQDSGFKIITNDVKNFWEAVDLLKTDHDTASVFQRLVIDRASDEFRVFIRKWKIQAIQYAYQLRKYPKFYESLRAYSIKLINSEDSIRKIISRFEKLYPNLHHADICIGFGNFSTGGNIAIEGGTNLVYIGLEYHGLDSTAFVDELSASTRDYASRSNFFRTIIHELVHIQHRTHGLKVARTFDGNLLANRILSEGIADFIAQIIVPYGNSGNHYRYGEKNETALKEKLKNDLYNTGSGNWFGGNDDLFIDRPRDLGYYMGSAIGRNYYVENIHKGNLTGLIEIKNYRKFIEQSKYFN